MPERRAHVVSFDDSPLQLNSHLDSDKYNDIIDSLKMSTIRAINRGRDITTKLTSLNKALAAENGYLTSKVMEVSTLYTNLTKMTSSEAIITAFDPTIAAYTHGCTINKLAGQVTVANEPGRRWSKVVRYTDTTGHRRPSKDTYITIDSALKSPSDDVYNILDGRMDTFWLYDTAEKAAHTIDISFPTSIRPYVNALTMTPFPMYSFNLTRIRVYKADGGSVEVIPNGLDASSMGVLDLHLAPLSWGNRIAIDITANGDVIGLSHLDLFLIDYIDDYAQVTFEVTSLDQKAFTHIESIDLMDFGLQGTNVDDPSYNRSNEMIVTAYTGTTEADIVDANATPISPATLRGEAATELKVAKTAANNLYLTFKFKAWNGQSPIFRAAKITYRS